MRPLLGGLAASLLLMWTAGAQAADTAAPTAPAPASSHALTPKVVAASLSPDWLLKATLYHAGAAGVGGIDSIGCKPVAMRTVATDPKLIPRRTVLFIAETVGLPMPGGGVHDGFWYASDVGGAIKGNRIDLYTGAGRGSMAPIFKLNLKKLTVAKAGTFKGCPKAAGHGNHADLLMQIARRSGILTPQFAVIDYVADRIKGVQASTPER
ncbi:MAG TPA: 3D domain-containing protein [Caulobacteraceae bacterium]|nr:3D domain-containing protein [Caulobacteraceae bacterium]